MAVIDTIYVATQTIEVVNTPPVDSGSFVERNFSDITNIIEVILIGFYVLFTIKTFRQIRQQTDLQLKAYLNFDHDLLSDKQIKADSVISDYINGEFANDWKDSMSKAFPNLADSDVFDGGYYALKLTNYGNTEIKSFEITAQIEILNSKESIEERKLTPSENKKFEICFNHILKRGESITVPLFSTASYPIFHICTSGKYVDVRGQEYAIGKIQLDGENNHIQ